MQHIALRALFKENPYRRRGMGIATIRYRNKLAMWASPFGYPRYSANQFKVISSLDIDLRDWAPDAKGNDKVGKIIDAGIC